MGASGDDSSALIEFTPLWKKSVKLPFVTKNKNILCHLVGTSGDNLSALIEFTPCEKQKYQVTLCN